MSMADGRSVGADDRSEWETQSAISRDIPTSMIADEIQDGPLTANGSAEMRRNICDHASQNVAVARVNVPHGAFWRHNSLDVYHV